MFQKFKDTYCTIKSDILSYRSPIRWAFLSLLFAAFLFLWEMSLSYYSLYLTLAGGGAVVTIELLQTIFTVIYLIFHILCVIGAFGILTIIILLGISWLKDRDMSKEDIIIKGIPEQMDELKKKMDKMEKKLRGK